MREFSSRDPPMTDEDAANSPQKWLGAALDEAAGRQEIDEFEQPILLTAEMIVARPIPALNMPPALADATAPAVRPWRGMLIAGGLHALILCAVVFLIKQHLPPPPPDGEAISVVVEASPAPATPPSPPPAAASVAATDPTQQAQKTPPIPAPPVPPAPVTPVPPAAEKLATAPIPTPLAASPKSVTPPIPPPKAQPPAPKAMPAPVKQAEKMPAPASRPVAAHAPAPPSYDAAVSHIGITRPAQLLSGTTVLYSMYSSETGAQGSVTLDIQVLPNGAPGEVSVVASSGYARLDNVARNSVLTWHFKPALKNGVPVASVLMHVVVFELPPSGGVAP